MTAPMTTLPEEAVKSMPERIYAKVHGASTDVIRGHRGLIGGWNEHKRDGQIEYLRSDLIATYQAAVLEKAVQIAERPVIGFSDGAVEASKYIASSIRALSYPDHADAGKVEGGGWSMSPPKFHRYPYFVENINGKWCLCKHHGNGASHTISVHETAREARDAAPASEGAE